MTQLQNEPSRIENGNISIHAQNIMPIIKKWLYSDKDIFIRELIANGTDAITKLIKLEAMGEASTDSDFSITLTVDGENNTLTFCDNGIGMTAEEVRTYINQVAFSGAQDFMKKYEQAGDDAIIGHFGLGFYSAFMVSDTVQINTRSFASDAQPVRWQSDGDSEYALYESDKETRGSEITLFLQEDSKEFSDVATVRKVVEKYCAFLPYPIYVVDANAKPAEEIDAQILPDQEGDAEDAPQEDFSPEPVDHTPKPVNDTNPLWLKNASDITKEQYIDFYRKVFSTYEEPLFWIHLNVDYPFNLKGILYFPRLNNRFEMMEGQIKLYNNQVFVADNIKEVIPEFLLLLKGVIDCPDLPLNVSRSFLQNDGTVKKMQSHITKKVADKLKGLFTNERETYEKDWADINPFVKFGVIKDDKFYDQVKEALIFQKLDKTYLTLDELQEYAKNNGGKAYYASDAKAQAFYIDLFTQQDQMAVLLDGIIDNHFISYIERKNTGLSFARIDSEIAQSIKGQYDDMPEQAPLETLLRKATNDEKLNIEVAPIKSDLPALYVQDESMRRFCEMSAQYGGGFSMPPEGKLVLNGTSPVIKALATASGEKAELIAAYVHDIALMGRGSLDAEQVKGILNRSAQVLQLIDLQE